MMTPVVIVAWLVGVVSVGIAAAAWRALVRTGNKTMGFVLGAFALIALKNFAKGAYVLSGIPDTEAREVLFSVMDFGAVALIGWPILGARS